MKHEIQREREREEQPKCLTEKCLLTRHCSFEIGKAYDANERSDFVSFSFDYEYVFERG